MDVVLLGHGSRRGRDTDVGLQQVERRLQERMRNLKVRMAGFEFTRPTLEEAVQSLAREGSRAIAIMPFFLFDGKHVKTEIPEEIERLRSLLPHIRLTYARTLGIDSRLVQMVKERVEAALVDVGRRGPGTAGTILVTRGTPLEYGSADGLFELAVRVSAVYDGSMRVEPAQAQFASPTMESAARSLVEAGAEVVAVVPYLLFPGKVLYDNILPAVEAARHNYRNVEFRVAQTLGVDERLIDITLDRLREVGVAC
ncbi:MAG: sirohydrochlorin chelatase [Chloroflexi bacterium]|nr:sirohydrochlorin chelatase [Chloroflexota bacterium]